MAHCRAATAAAGRRRGGLKQTGTGAGPLEELSATALYGGQWQEEPGLPTLPGNLGENSATAALAWKEIDLVVPTGNRTPLLLAKNLNPPSRLCAYLTRPKARGETSPLRPPGLGGHPSGGGGNVLQGRLTEDGTLWSVCVLWRGENKGRPTTKM